MNFDNNFKDLFNRFYYHSRLRELTVYLVCLLIVSGLIMLFNGKKTALKKSFDRSDSSYSDYSTSSGYDYSAAVTAQAPLTRSTLHPIRGILTEALTFCMFKTVLFQVLL